jgi:hypothetical protein
MGQGGRLRCPNVPILATYIGSFALGETLKRVKNFWAEANLGGMSDVVSEKSFRSSEPDCCRRIHSCPLVRSTLVHI